MKFYFKDLPLLLVYFPYRWLIQIVPFQISYQIATLLGSIQYLFLPSRQKRQITTNLDLVFGNKLTPQEKKTILRCFYIIRQKRLVELFILGRKDYGRYFQTCSDEGRGHIDQVLSWGKGLIVLNFHFGSVNLVETYLAYQGYKITPHLVLPAQTKGASPWVSEQILNIKSSVWKERGNFQIVTSAKSLFSLVWTQYQCLRQNQIIDLTGDGALGKQFILVDFFNIKLRVPLGPALMAAKSGASMVPSFAILEKDNTQRFVFKEPIKVEGEDEETLKRVVQGYIKHLESYVSHYPDRWAYWTRMEVEGFENGIPVIRLMPGINE